MKLRITGDNLLVDGISGMISVNFKTESISLTADDRQGVCITTPNASVKMMHAPRATDPCVARKSYDTAKDKLKSMLFSLLGDPESDNGNTWAYNFEDEQWEIE
ncbi:hypothetical protein VPHK469_0105 [Vibrio phage K469]